jgi:hypothetical protein
VDGEDSAWDHRPGLNVRWSKFSIFRKNAPPGHPYQAGPWELWLTSGDGALVASCTSYHAIVAASRLLNGWCKDE